MTNSSAPGRRILFDISTSMRWVGPPTGISRVENKFALWAATHLPNVAFVFFDPTDLIYRHVVGDAVPFLSGEAAIDTFGLTNPAMPKMRRTDRIPAPLRQAFLWCTQTRRMTLRKLEMMRLQ